VAVEYAVVDGVGSALMELTGTLELSDIGPIRLRLLKCMADQPDALVVDLSAMRVGEPLALSVFLAASRQAERWPGIPFVLCAPASSRTCDLLAHGVLRRVPLFPAVEAARAQLAKHRDSLPTLSDELLPLAGAARHARNVTTEACLRWDLPHLVGPASLIVSELVSNVIDHAGTMATLRLSLRPHYLTISVRDGSTAEPVPPAQPVSMTAAAGRGLLLVKSIAHTWGWLPTDGGKVVWATLSRRIPGRD
jgi:Histidine kinase-like ATPase domain